MLWIVFVLGMFVGMLSATLSAWTAFQRFEVFRHAIRREVDQRDGIEFRPMPDRGLDELIYKPRDGSTTISKSVISRRRRK